MQHEGTLERVGDRARLTYTRSLNHAPAKVWRALTETEHLAAWFPDGAPAGEFVEGATLQFGVNDKDGPKFDGKVVTADPPRVLEFVWGEDTLRFELTPEGKGTVLTFTDTFDEYGKAARDGAGWHACVENLVHELDGTQPPADGVAHWRGLYAEYQEYLGPEASTIGIPAGHAVSEG
jgi:uncharacterized protein YndB with AHSA1/START domain